MYEYEWTVRYADTDPFGIAHYSKIVTAIHDVSDRFMEAIGFPFWEIAEEQGYGLPIVEFHSEFEQPIKAGDIITIQLVLLAGNRSLRFEYEAFTEEGELAFSAYEQRACVPVNGDSAMEVPEDLRLAIEPYVEEE